MARLLMVQWDSVMYNGVMSLAAYLKYHRHDVRVRRIDRDAVPNPNGYDAVGVSVHTGNLLCFRAFARRLQSTHPKVPLVVGGVLPTVAPDQVEPGPYFLVRGDGEEALLRLLEALATGAPPRADGLHYRGQPTTSVAMAPPIDVARCPVPDRDVYYREFPALRSARVAHFNFSRGCPYGCSFCYAPSVGALHGGYRRVRFRSPQQAIAEMEQAQIEHPFDAARIYDDNFGLRAEWLEHFADEYPRRIGKPFACYLRADLVDEHRVRLLQQAGCIEVGIGVETWSERLREEFVFKGLTNDQVRRAVGLLRRSSIAVTSFFMFGFPLETVSDALLNLDFSRELRPNHIWTSRVQVYPGTRLETLANRMGLWNAAATDYARVKNENLRRIFRIERLMQVARLLNLPTGLVRALSLVPLDALYDRLGWCVARRLNRRSLICNAPPSAGSPSSGAG